MSTPARSRDAQAARTTHAPRPPRRRRRRLGAHVRYLLALVARFKITVGLAAVLYGLVPLLVRALYVRPEGGRIGYGEALHHVYFLVFGQPSLPYVGNVWMEAINFLVPPLGVAVVVDGIVRFAYLFFAKHRSDKEWIEVTTRTLKDHVIVCGAGRVGYRVAAQLLALGKDVVVIEKREDAAFVGVLRDRDVPVLIDDIKSPQCLPRVNVERAAAIVCATDDDLANLNVALDARRLNPPIRVVIRVFDDDLVLKVRDAFRAEALSSSALAAPAMALSALDPRIAHSFQVGGRLMVVSTFVASKALAGRTVGELYDAHGAATLELARGNPVVHVAPRGDTVIEPGDGVTLQAEYNDYLRLREFTGEVEPPTSSAATAR